MKGGRQLRSLLAFVATAWFALNALLIGDGWMGTVGDGTLLGLYAIARILFVGLAVLSLGFVDRRSLTNLWTKKVIGEDWVGSTR